MKDFEPVILAGVYQTSGDESYEDFEHSMDELAELAKACYMNPKSMVTQTLDHPSAAYYLGSGKVEEIAALVQDTRASRVILNDTLSPSQIRNLQNGLGVEVTDRTALILEIFHSRARTREAKLQVEVARLSYLKPRLIGMWEKQNRQGGASGSMSSKGEGETQLEIDRRTIDHRLAELRRELKVVEKERVTQRKKRQDSLLPLVALVGYTNAGKSTIMNSMVASCQPEDKKVFEANMLFATLDTTMRRISTPREPDFLLSDTVGFIKKLPTSLVEAFKSTLEEVKEADLILQVVDYSDPYAKDHMQVTTETIAELDAGDVPMIIVYNKCDQVADCVYPRVGPEYPSGGTIMKSLFLSAREEASQQLLKETVLETLYGPVEEKTEIVPYSDGARLNNLLGSSRILSQEYLPEGTKLVYQMRKRS